MRIIVHSTVGEETIRGSLGADDYSYYFVRRSFTQALRRFAEVVVVADPATEVDPIFDRATADGEACLFLSFVPPQKTVLGLRCPIVPVFAWEFSTIPFEVWDGDIRNDWRAVFAVSEAAIALSSYTVGVVRATVGDTFPIAAIPAPVFERFAHATSRAVSERVSLRIAGTVLDTACIDAVRRAPTWPRRTVPLLTPAPLPPLTLPASEPVLALVVEPEAGILLQQAAGAAMAEPLVILVDPAPDAAAVLPQASIGTNAEEPRIGWRRRVQITRHFGLEWYRLAVRDLLPRPVRSANALAGRTMHRAYGRLRLRHPSRPDQAPTALLAPPRAVEPILLEPPAAIGPERLPVEAASAGPLDPAIDRAVVPGPPVLLASPKPVPPVSMTTVALDGVVFVSMFSPRDGRKNWNDIVTAFCWAHRDTQDATLVLKIVAEDYGYEQGLRLLLEELAPFRCRVVVLHGYLETPDYRALIGAATFYVNASHCEGLCLPVTEFMSAGTPAIAPGHTAFEDYISPDNAFVIGSGIENAVWPADGRDLFRTTRYRIDWHGLMLAYREGYRVAKDEPERYRAMAHSARETMRRFCGIEPVTEALRTVLSGRTEAGLERAA